MSQRSGPSADSDPENQVSATLASARAPAGEQKSGLKRFFNEDAHPAAALPVDADVRHPELLSPEPLSSSSPEQFSCGRVHLSRDSASSARRRRSLPPPDSESDGDLAYDYSHLNESEALYDYHAPRPVNSTLDLRSARPQPAGGAEAPDPQPTFFPPWDYFDALPNITAQKNPNQRIVGGEEAFPGQLPWQVPRAERGPSAHPLAPVSPAGRGWMDLD